MHVLPDSRLLIANFSNFSNFSKFASFAIFLLLKESTMSRLNSPVRPLSRMPALAPLCLTPLALLPVSLAFAQQATNPQADHANVLDTVQVTAKRGSQTNTVVRANRIEVEQAVSLQELFRQTPEVAIGGGALPVAQKLYVRGLSERMLAITIDGAAQPESAYHHTGQVMIEPELLKRVEIEAGTGAASAGPGALAGALRFTTKNASDLLRPQEQAGVLLKGAHQTVNGGNKFSASAFGRIGANLDWLVSQTALNSGDYADGNGNRVANTAVKSRASFAKLGGTLGAAQQWQLTHERHQDEGLRNQRTNLLLAGFNPGQRQRTERESTALHYRYAPDNPWLAVTATVYQNENAILLAQGTPNFERDGTHSYGMNLANVMQLDKHRITVGFDYRHDRGFAHVATGALPDDNASVAGVFVEDEIALNPQWRLGLGARHDRYRYAFLENSEAAPAVYHERQLDSSGSSPSLNLTFTPQQHLSLRFSHARALRGVGVMEPFLKAFQSNAAILHPERARTTELGAQWQHGAWFGNATVFRQQIDNYIGYDDARQNLGKVKVAGYSASAGVRLAQSSLSLGVAQARPELNGAPLSSGEALLLGNASGRTWVIQFDTAMPQQHLKTGWTARMTEQLSYVPAGERSKPGFGVHDAYVQWLPQGKDSLSLTLSIKNLFNKHYYDQSSFGYHPRWGQIAALPESGRDVRLALATRF